MADEKPREKIRVTTDRRFVVIELPEGEAIPENWNPDDSAGICLDYGKGPDGNTRGCVYKTCYWD